MKIRIVSLIVVLLCPVYAAQAEVMVENAVANEILETILYSFIGILMAFVSYKVIDFLTPGDISQDIVQNQNSALAILAGSIMVGVCIIIAAVLTN